MNKAQAIQSFWEGFSLNAYDENTVPDDAAMPYITYDVAEDSLDSVVNLHGNLWYRSTSWREISEKANEIAEYVGLGGKVIPIENGYAWLCRGAPFIQRMNDEDSSIRRIYINIQAEYLTAN